MGVLRSYSSSYALGHRAILSTLFEGSVVVEEKIDGSQFSFGVRDGHLHCRSKGKEIFDPAAEVGLFGPACKTALELAPLLIDGWTYRGEALAKPKHNTLAYDRVPKGNVILWDIDAGNECYLSRQGKEKEAERLGLEVVPVFYEGVVGALDPLMLNMERVSCLGGSKIEGMVFKNYGQFGTDKKILVGKYVSERFKELNGVEFKKANPTTRDVVSQLGDMFRCEARWDKAVQHLKERGEWQGSPRDIGPLIKEVQADIKVEGADLIRDKLYGYAIPTILRLAIRGFPEWYRERLLKEAIEQVEAAQ